LNLCTQTLARSLHPLQGLDEQPANMPYEQMPLYANNVDLAVATNALFGVTSALLDDPASYVGEFDRWGPPLLPVLHVCVRCSPAPSQPDGAR
jgi:hypothetical protein